MIGTIVVYIIASQVSLSVNEPGGIVIMGIKAIPDITALDLTITRLYSVP